MGEGAKNQSNFYFPVARGEGLRMHNHDESWSHGRWKTYSQVENDAPARSATRLAGRAKAPVEHLVEGRGRDEVPFGESAVSRLSPERVCLDVHRVVHPPPLESRAERWSRAPDEPMIDAEWSWGGGSVCRVVCVMGVCVSAREW